MRQGLEDEFFAVLNDVLTLQKPDLTEVENIRAHVSSKSILIIDVHLPIDVGDKLIRTLPNGSKDIFIVDDPGYHEAVAGLQPTFRERSINERHLFRVCHRHAPPRRV